MYFIILYNVSTRKSKRKAKNVLSSKTIFIRSMSVSIFDFSRSPTPAAISVVRFIVSATVVSVFRVAVGRRVFPTTVRLLIDLGSMFFVLRIVRETIENFVKHVQSIRDDKQAERTKNTNRYN